MINCCQGFNVLPRAIFSLVGSPISQKNGKAPKWRDFFNRKSTYQKGTSVSVQDLVQDGTVFIHKGNCKIHFLTYDY